MAIVPLGLAGASALYRWRHLSRGLRYLGLWMGWALLAEAVSRTLAARHQPNLFLLPTYTSGELTLLLLFYRDALHSRRFARLVPWLAGSFVAYTLAAGLTATDLPRFNTEQRVLECVVVLACVGLFFRKLLNELTVPHLGREPLFWTALGQLLYFGGAMPIFLFSNYLLSYSRLFNLTVWAVHAALYMVLNVCYCLALWLPREK